MSAANIIYFRLHLCPEHCNRQIWQVTFRCGWPSALVLWNELSASIRATNAKTSDCFKRVLKNEDAPVSMNGRLVADDSTSEEQFWSGADYSKDYNINIKVSVYMQQ